LEYSKKYEKVSIVIPCWNGENFIGEAIQSCFDQEYPNIEIIVINDGSTDGSLKAVDRFGDKILVKTTENGGACRARNVGLAMARGKYVMFLDSDDYLEGKLISSLVEGMAASDAKMGFCPWVKVRDGDELMSTVMHDHLNWSEMASAWLLGHYVPPCAVMWRRSILDRIGGWDESLEKNQDGDIAIRALLTKPSLFFSSVGRGVYRQHDSEMRVSRASPEKVHCSSLKIFNRVQNWLDKSYSRNIEKSLGLYAYGIADYMYSNKLVEEGRFWEVAANRKGVKYPSNTFIGSLFVFLFGLRRKIILREYLALLK